MKFIMTGLRLLVLLTGCWLGSVAMKLSNQLSANMLEQDSILNLIASTDTSKSGLEKSAEKAEQKAERSEKVSEMEKMVMLLAGKQKLARAKQPSTADVADNSADISKFVVSLKTEIQKMINDLLQEVDGVENECRTIITGGSVIGGCPNPIGAIGGGDALPVGPNFSADELDVMRAAHAACRGQIPTAKSEAESCEAIRTSAITAETEALAIFNGLNIFESPAECEAVTEDAELYLLNMWNHFEAKKIAWWDAWWALGNATERVNQWVCSEKTLAYYAQVEKCAKLQLDFENAACDVYSRTQEYCDNLQTCASEQSSRCTKIVGDGKAELEELGDEWHALKRIECLLGAFAREDIDAAIDECKAKTYAFTGSAPSCDEKCPDPIIGGNSTGGGGSHLEFCQEGGLDSVVYRPSTVSFRNAEYTAKGIEAGACFASCCDGTYYYWVTHSGRYARRSFAWSTENVYTANKDNDGNWQLPDLPGFKFAGKDEFTSAEAKLWCETATKVRCAGIYDKGCTGQVGQIILDVKDDDYATLPVSKSGSCVHEMVLGQGTTLTSTLMPHRCTWQVVISNSDFDPSVVNETWTLYNADFDDVFKFASCTTEGTKGEECVSKKNVSNGARVLSGRFGDYYHSGACCDSTTNAVISSRKLDCDGFKNEYTKYTGKYLPRTMLLSDTETTYESAAVQCLKLGAMCSGIVDDNCDGVGFSLINGVVFNGTEPGEFLDSSAGTCSFIKERVAPEVLAARPFLPRYQLFLQGTDRCASSSEELKVVTGQYECESLCDESATCQFYSYGKSSNTGQLRCYLSPDCQYVESIRSDEFFVYTRSVLSSGLSSVEYFHEDGRCKGDPTFAGGGAYCVEDTTLALCIEQCNEFDRCGAFHRDAGVGADDYAQCCLYKAQTATGPMQGGPFTCYQKRPKAAPPPAEPAVSLPMQCFSGSSEEEGPIPLVTNGNWEVGKGVDYNAYAMDMSYGTYMIKCHIGGGVATTSGAAEAAPTALLLKIAGGNSNLGGIETPRQIQVMSGQSMEGRWTPTEIVTYDADVTDNVDTATARTIALTTPINSTFVGFAFLNNHGPAGGPPGTTVVRQMELLGRSSA